jgi:hypothetical protein
MNYEHTPGIVRSEETNEHKPSIPSVRCLQRNHAARGVLLCPRGWANVDASSRRTDHESTGSDLRPERLSLDFGHGSELARRLALE